MKVLLFITGLVLGLGASGGLDSLSGPIMESSFSKANDSCYFIFSNTGDMYKTIEGYMTLDSLKVHILRPDFRYWRFTQAYTDACLKELSALFYLRYVPSFEEIDSIAGYLGIRNDVSYGLFRDELIAYMPTWHYIQRYECDSSDSL